MFGIESTFFVKKNFLFFTFFLYVLFPHWACQRARPTERITYLGLRALTSSGEKKVGKKPHTEIMNLNLVIKQSAQHMETDRSDYVAAKYSPTLRAQIQYNLAPLYYLKTILSIFSENF